MEPMVFKMRIFERHLLMQSFWMFLSGGFERTLRQANSLEDGIEAIIAYESLTQVLAAMLRAVFFFFGGGRAPGVPGFRVCSTYRILLSVVRG